MWLGIWGMLVLGTSLTIEQAPPIKKSGSDSFGSQSFHVLIPSYSDEPEHESFQSRDHFIVVDKRTGHWFNLRGLRLENTEGGISLRHLPDETSKEVVLQTIALNTGYGDPIFFLHRYEIEVMGETAADWRKLIAKALQEKRGDEVVDLEMSPSSLLWQISESNYDRSLKMKPSTWISELAHRTRAPSLLGIAVTGSACLLLLKLMGYL